MKNIPRENYGPIYEISKSLNYLAVGLLEFNSIYCILYPPPKTLTFIPNLWGLKCDMFSGPRSSAKFIKSNI